MKKAELLDAMRTERACWDALIASLDEAQMTQPGVAGQWSVKDIIAHLIWHEREMIGMLQARALVGSELWELPLDQRNELIFQESRERDLSGLLAEAPQVFRQFLELVETLSEEDLVDPQRFPGMLDDWQPWRIIAGNAHEHYRDHIRDVEAWLERSNGKGN
jgi:hypothetical protein